MQLESLLPLLNHSAQMLGQLRYLLEDEETLEYFLADLGWSVEPTAGDVNILSQAIGITTSVNTPLSRG